MFNSAVYWGILLITIALTGIGCLMIVKREPIRYGIITFMSVSLTIFLCYLFYAIGFYRFVLPLPSIFVAVATSFTFLALFCIYYKPVSRSFAFFFIVITVVFSIEVILKKGFSFIVYRNGWDYWDSYSLIWVYVRLFSFLGDWIVPSKYRKPFSSDRKAYWIIFVITIAISASGFIYLVN